MAFATKEEFEARHGEADGRVEPLLEDASALICRALDGSGLAWVVDPEKSEAAPHDVKALCIQVAFRAWSNPEGLESEQLGAHRVAFAKGAAGIILTKDERRDLKRATGLGSFQSTALRTPLSGDEEPSMNDLS